VQQLLRARSAAAPSLRPGVLSAIRGSAHTKMRDPRIDLVAEG
jgi:hypothetical protein